MSIATKHKKRQDHWIQNAHMKKGALHKELGIPQGQKIPVSTLEADSHKSGKLGHRARAALAMEGR